MHLKKWSTDLVHLRLVALCCLYSWIPKNARKWCFLTTWTFISKAKQVPLATEANRSDRGMNCWRGACKTPNICHMQKRFIKTETYASKICGLLFYLDRMEQSSLKALKYPLTAVKIFCGPLMQFPVNPSGIHRELHPYWETTATKPYLGRLICCEKQNYMIMDWTKHCIDPFVWRTNQTKGVWLPYLGLRAHEITKSRQTSFSGFLRNCDTYFERQRNALNPLCCSENTDRPYTFLSKSEHYVLFTLSLIFKENSQ